MLIGGGWAVNDRASFDRAAWLADYEQLKKAVEESYANLQWSRTSKAVDLVSLNVNAVRALQEATSNSGARAALADFVAGFDDGHFSVERKPPQPLAALLNVFERSSEASVNFAMSAIDVCNALGFKTVEHELAVDGAHPLANTTFAAGTLTTASKRAFGIIRIPLFQQREYGAVCERSWPAFQANRTGVCDAECQDHFGVLVKHELAQALADDARALVSAGAEGVVIDLTGNGGGTEWAEFAAVALTHRPLQLPRIALIRAITRADSAKVSCNLARIWQDRDFQPSCWNIIVMPADTQARQDGAYARPYDGRLFIMTDARTASASEQLAATLRDNEAAYTIGQKTMGVGCGFVDGGNPVTLTHSRLVVWMPNCARFRADGSNEFEGVIPDYPVDWGSNTATKTAALLDALERFAPPRSR